MSPVWCVWKQKCKHFNEERDTCRHETTAKERCKIRLVARSRQAKNEEKSWEER